MELPLIMDSMNLETRTLESAQSRYITECSAMFLLLRGALLADRYQRLDSRAALVRLRSGLEYDVAVKGFAVFTGSEI